MRCLCVRVCVCQDGKANGKEVTEASRSLSVRWVLRDSFLSVDPV